MSNISLCFIEIFTIIMSAKKKTWPLHVLWWSGFFLLDISDMALMIPSFKIEFERSYVEKIFQQKRAWNIILYRAWVSTGAKGAWHPQNFWAVMSGTCVFWQFYFIILNFEDLLVVGTRCFKFPTQALLYKGFCILTVPKRIKHISWLNHSWFYVHCTTKLTNSNRF